MECNNCKNRIVLHGFSDFICNICKEEDVSVFTPPNKICKNCAEKENICETCCKDLNKDIS